jgi:hypothetical protein
MPLGAQLYALLCPQGLKCVPPLMCSHPLLTMSLLGVRAPHSPCLDTVAHYTMAISICPFGAHECSLGLNYAPWGSFMFPGTQERAPLKRACPPPMCARPSYVCVPWGSYMSLGGSFMPLGLNYTLFYAHMGLSAYPPSCVRAPLLACPPPGVCALHRRARPSFPRRWAPLPGVHGLRPSMRAPIFIRLRLLFIHVCPTPHPYVPLLHPWAPLRESYAPLWQPFAPPTEP